MLHTELIAPLPELLARHAAARPDKVAYWDSTRSVTYLQLGRRTAAIAASLTKIGVREGDKVALFLPNGVDWVEACFACLRAARSGKAFIDCFSRILQILLRPACLAPGQIGQRESKQQQAREYACRQLGLPQLLLSLPSFFSGNLGPLRFAAI